MPEPDLIGAMVDIIRSDKVDLQTARSAATVISIDANFNARVAGLKSRNVDKARLFEVLDFAEGVLADARALATAVERGLSTAEAGSRLLALRNKISNYDI